MAIRAAKEKCGVQEKPLDRGLQIVLVQVVAPEDGMLCSLNDEPMCAQPFNIHEALLLFFFHLIRLSALQSVSTLM